MKIFAALDVSDKSTHVCVVDGDGAIMWRGVCATDPAVLATTLERHAPGLERVVMETGPLSAFLYHGLIERDVPAVCICARRATGALSGHLKPAARSERSRHFALDGVGAFRCQQDARAGRRDRLRALRAAAGNPRTTAPLEEVERRTGRSLQGTAQRMC
ncbi:MAG: family transposase, partial [Bradyrhizobium sp.]|nr:family transposase [Bradyrhizobium sp.]